MQWFHEALLDIWRNNSSPGATKNTGMPASIKDAAFLKYSLQGILHNLVSGLELVNGLL
jgi:hypothetical protein